MRDPASDGVLIYNTNGRLMPWGLNGLPACSSMAHIFSHLSSRGRRFGWKGAGAQMVQHQHPYDVWLKKEPAVRIPVRNRANRK